MPLWSLRNLKRFDRNGEMDLSESPTMLSCSSGPVTTGADETALGDFYQNLIPRTSWPTYSIGDWEQFLPWVDVIEVHTLRRKLAATVGTWMCFQGVQPPEPVQALRAFHLLVVTALVRLVRTVTSRFPSPQCNRKFPTFFARLVAGFGSVLFDVGNFVKTVFRFPSLALLTDLHSLKIVSPRNWIGG